MNEVVLGGRTAMSLAPLNLTVALDMVHLFDGGADGCWGAVAYSRGAEPIF